MDSAGREPGATQLTLSLHALPYCISVGDRLQKLRKERRAMNLAAGFLDSVVLQYCLRYIRLRLKLIVQSEI
jgi:hypothetical protein